MSPHIRNMLRSCKAQGLKDVFSQAILEDQRQKLRALDFETPRADSIAHCEINAIRSLSFYRCGSTSHLVRECPMPAESAPSPANNGVNQNANDNSTSNNTGNNDNIQDALGAITQALQALTQKIEKCINQHKNHPTQTITTNHMIKISHTIKIANTMADINTSNTTGTNNKHK